MSARALFGAVIVAILLVLYVLLTKFAISLLGCEPQPGCLEQFTDSMASGLALINGLVSAVVIAELGLPQSTNLFSRLLGDNPSRLKVTVLKIMTFLYIGAWLGVGLWVLIATWQKPVAIPALTALARAWFGLAVAAGYVYFGLKPPKEAERPRELER